MVVAKKTPASSAKKSVKKKIIAKKTPTKKVTSISKNQGLSNISVMGLLHLVGGVLGSRGRLAVIIFYLLKRDTFSAQDTKTFNNIVNFNISFLLYAIGSAILIIVFIGAPLLIAVSLTYLVLLVVSSINYIMDKPYDIPLSIQILK